MKFGQFMQDNIKLYGKYGLETKFQAVFYFRKIHCKKESKEVSMLDLD